MPKTIIQTINFNASPAKLFALYADPKTHSAVTGGKVVISKKVGSPFKAFNGTLVGTTLGVIPNRVFVQAWRGGGWKSKDADSLLVLNFEKNGKGSKVTMVHANIPDKHFRGIKSGWNTYYWRPWKRYLSKRG